jgi:predicted nucleic acid-binding Zn ribbon protein
MSDPPASVCETCGAGPVEKVLFPVAVHFKGSGFYATDYGKGKKKKDGAKDDGGASETKKSESKPDSSSSEKTSSAAAD